MEIGKGYKGKKRIQEVPFKSHITAQAESDVASLADTVGLKAIARIHVNLLFFVTSKLVQGSGKMTSDFQLAPSEPVT